MTIRAIGSLLVLCALGFLCTSSGLLPANARTLTVYSDNHGEFRAGQQGKKRAQQKTGKPTVNTGTKSKSGFWTAIPSYKK